jgi:hypothetical protein
LLFPRRISQGLAHALPASGIGQFSPPKRLGQTATPAPKPSSLKPDADAGSFDLPFLIRRSWAWGVPVPMVREGRFWSRQFIDLR